MSLAVLWMMYGKHFCTKERREAVSKTPFVETEIKGEPRAKVNKRCFWAFIFILESFCIIRQSQTLFLCGIMLTAHGFCL